MFSSYCQFVGCQILFKPSQVVFVMCTATAATAAAGSSAEVTHYEFMSLSLALGHGSKAEGRKGLIMGWCN